MAEAGSRQQAIDGISTVEELADEFETETAVGPGDEITSHLNNFASDPFVCKRGNAICNKVCAARSCLIKLSHASARASR